jgi:trk system potassium uptake protein TrkH
MFMVKEDLIQEIPKFIHRELSFFTKLQEPVLKRKVNPLNFLVFGLFTIILLGSFLLWLPFTHEPGATVSYIDALFTSTSASTVTGLVTKDTATTFNFFGQLIIFILINFGGLGYMTIITFFFLSRNTFGLKYAIFMKESLNLPSIGEIFKLAKKVFFSILVFEFIGIAILFLVWSDFGIVKGLWMAIFHGMSAFNNAGFDLMGGFKSLTDYHFNFLVNFALGGLIFLGGIGFIVISDLIQYFKREKKTLTLHTRIVLTSSLILIILGALGFFFLEYNNALQPYASNLDKGLISVFQSISARTAGFNTVSLENIHIPTILLFCLLMFIGASPGGTGSGIKTTTFSVLILWFFSSLKNQEEPQVGKRRINNDILNRALLLFFSSVMVLSFFIFLLVLFEPFPLSKLLFEAFSAFGTVGLTTGITPFLTAYSKFALIALMIIGRLTPLTLINILMRKKKTEIRYPEENVAVG